jgi:hypothetical protein
LPVVRNVPVGVLLVLGEAGRSSAIGLSTWLMQLHPGERVLSQFISSRVVVTSVVRFVAQAEPPAQVLRLKHATSSVGMVHCVWKFVLIWGRVMSS